MAREFVFRLATRTDEDRAADAANFPGSLYGEPGMLEREGVDEFRIALKADDEERIQRAICRCPYLLQYVVPNSGHHGTWVFPKAMIRTKRVNGQPGLIPDFLVATRNSLGFTWHIVELKKPNVQFSNAAGNGYSTTGHQGIAQCASYAAHFRDYIETVRANVGISEIITPKNVILVIGDTRYERPEQTRRRREFEEIANNVVIASYDRIRRGIMNDRPDWWPPE